MFWLHGPNHPAVVFMRYHFAKTRQYSDPECAAVWLSPSSYAVDQIDI